MEETRNKLYVPDENIQFKFVWMMLMMSVEMISGSNDYN